MQEIDIVDLLSGILNLAAATTRLIASLRDRRPEERKTTD
jgi:hypothetical protein